MIQFMSKYTTQLRFVCENLADYNESQDYPEVDGIIQLAIPKIFSFKYPIFDEAYRNVLETKILRHYYTRELGFETYGLWKLKLNTKLNEIMPYYNQLYKSELLEFNPFYDVNLTRDYQRKNDGTQNVNGTADITSNSNTFSDTTRDSQSDNERNGTDKQTTVNTNTGSVTKKDAYSDTPQGELTNVENLSYLTNARIITDGTSNTNNVQVDGTSGDKTTLNENENVVNNTETDATSKNKTTANTILSNLEDYTETVVGKQGTQSYNDLLMSFRNTFLNIDMMIIKELSELFLQLW